MDDERVSEAYLHRQQEWMMRGFLRLMYTDRQQEWMMRGFLRFVHTHRHTDRVDDERVSDACPHRQQEWMMRGFLMLVHTDKKSG